MSLPLVPARGPVAMAPWLLLLAALALPAQVQSVKERTGGRLEARGDRVVRVLRGTEVALRALPGRPTGEIRQFEPDPTGATFVAAEHGLFIVHPSVDTIDRLDLSDGAPEGSPVGVVLDRQRRLWIATEEAFGVVHTGFFYGRSGAYPGIPDPPYTGLRSHPEGGLEVLTADGAFRYVPDQGPAPQVAAITLDGAPWKGDTLHRTWPLAVEVAAEGSGAGGASFRWVADGHHNWRPLTDGLMVEGLNPGDRSVWVVAVDRDLRRSEPTVVPIRCAYLTWLRPVPLLGGTGLFAALVLAAFLRGARRSGGGRARYVRAAVSAGILMWLIIQLAAGLFPHARGWPFCGFSMYTGKSLENAVSGPVIMTAVRSDGATRPAALDRFRLVFDTSWQVIRPFLNGDEGQRRTMLGTYNGSPGCSKVSGLQVVQLRKRLTRNGKVAVAPLVMGKVELPR